MDDDISAVDKFPAVISRSLMPVVDLQTGVVDFIPDLVHYTLQVSN